MDFSHDERITNPPPALTGAQREQYEHMLKIEKVVAVVTPELLKGINAIPESIASPAASIAGATVTSTATSSSSAKGSLPTPALVRDKTSMRLLDKLSSMTGIENERLAYEITLDKNFRLLGPTMRGDGTDSTGGTPRSPRSAAGSSPTVARPSLPFPSSLSTPAVRSLTTGNVEKGDSTIVAALRDRMLRLMADKLIASLVKPSISTVAELAVGELVPVVSAAPLPAGGMPLPTCEPFGAARTSAAFTAKVLGIYYNIPSANADTTTATSSSSSSDRVSNFEMDEVAADNDVSSEEANMGQLHTTEGAVDGEEGKTGGLDAIRAEVKSGSAEAVVDAKRGVDRGVPVPCAIDVEYLADGAIEKRVPVSRVLLRAEHTPDPQPLLRALEDLCSQIAALTPNRKDVLENLHKSIDFNLLKQMIVNNALSDPAKDLLPVLQFLQRTIQSLQAPDRMGRSQRWIDNFAEAFVHPHSGSTSVSTASHPDTISNIPTVPPTVGIADGTAASSAGRLAESTTGQHATEVNRTVNQGQSERQRQSRSLDEVAPLLPGFFERATLFIEEIQRDAANYYISILAPAMQQHGAEYLQHKFLERLATGEQHLFLTTSLLLAQLYPADVCRETMAEIAEAGIVKPSYSSAASSTAVATASSFSSSLAPTPAAATVAAPSAASGVQEGQLFTLSDLLDRPSGSAPNNSITSTDAVIGTDSSNNTAREKKGMGSSPTREEILRMRPLLVRGIAARAFLSLLQLPVRLDSPQGYALNLMPETLLSGTPPQMQLLGIGGGGVDGTGMGVGSIGLGNAIVGDATRLSRIRDLIDTLSLEASFVITARQLLARYRIPSVAQDETILQHRLDVLLNESDVRMDSVVTEIIEYVKFCHNKTGQSSQDKSILGQGEAVGTGPALSVPPHSSSSSSSFPASAAPEQLSLSYGAPIQHRSGPAAGTGLAAEVAAGATGTNKVEKIEDTGDGAAGVRRGSESGGLGDLDEAELYDRVQTAVKDLLSPSNPVLVLFTKRIYKVILRVLLGQPFQAKLAAYSLNSKGLERNMTKLLSQTLRMFSHTMAIHGTTYSALLHAAAQVLLSEEGSAGKES